MKRFLFLLPFVVTNTLYSQSSVNSKKLGILEFVELDHGLAHVVDGTVEKLDKSPTGNHGWLKDLEIVKVTDSIEVTAKANFGIVYMVKAKDTADINVTIEWIYPKEVINEKGQKFKSIKYTTNRPTNIPSGSTYSLDAPYEMVKGDWVENIYLEGQRVFSRTFVLY